MGKHQVCLVEDLPSGARKIVTLEGRSIGVFNVDDLFYAVRNSCPHKGAPLCRGVVTGLVTAPELYQLEMERPGEIVRCPWHGWEFDITTGASVFNPHRLRVKRYDVSVEPGPIIEFENGSVLNEEDDDPSIETFPISIEESHEQGRPAVYVHI